MPIYSLKAHDGTDLGLLRAKNRKTAADEAAEGYKKMFGVLPKNIHVSRPAILGGVEIDVEKGKATLIRERIQ